MNFEALRRRVKRAEAVVAIRSDETGQRWTTMTEVWRKGWTPLRIITVGLAGGFIAGKLEPGKARFHGARWLQMLGAVSNLVSAAQASFAAEEADRAAQPEATAADTGERSGAADAGTEAAEP